MPVTLQMITLIYGKGTQTARIEGESKSGKHWIIRRIYSTRGTLYKTTSQIKKEDYRIFEIKEVSSEIYNSFKIETSSSSYGHWANCKGCKFCNS